MSFSVVSARSWVGVRAPVRTVIVAVVLVATVAGFAVGAWSGPEAAIQAGPELVRLMRFMAALKAGLALLAVGAVVWRLRAPVVVGRFVAYAAAVAAMSAGPGLIWGMSDIVAGSALLHGGLLATVLLLWRDPGTAAWLDGLIAGRRLRRQLGG